MSNSPVTRVFAALFVASVLYGLAMLARPDEHFLSRPFIEDAFYSLSVARTLGEGGGISIDGVTPTNGVQPLICFLYAPAFAIDGGNLYVALRIALALQVLFAGLCALAVAWLARALVRDDAHADERTGDVSAASYRDEIFWIVAGTVMASYSLSVHLLNGLETSLASAFAFASVAFYVERVARPRDRAPLAELARLGALLGLGVLARIDLAILAAVIAGWHLVAGPRATPLRERLAGSAVIGLVSVLVSLPWWLYNVIGFGHLMPTSGLAQKDLLTDRFASADLVLRGVSNALLLVLHVPGDLDGLVAYVGLLVAAAIAIAIVAVPPLRRRSAIVLAEVLTRYRLADAAPLGIFVTVLVVYYTFFFGAPHFIPRYLTPLWLLITMLLLIAAYALLRTSSGTVTRRALAVVTAVAIAASAWAQTRNFTRDGLYSNAMLFPAEWIGRHTSESETIGMFQSGTTGFLYRRVTNLDGKVNPRALEALRTGTVARLADSAGFDYIIDLDFYTRHIFSDPAMRARYTPIDTLPFEFVIWKRND